MRDCYVIVYNENDRTSYIQETSGNIFNPDGESMPMIVTVPTVVNATLYDTWDEAWDKITEWREKNMSLGHPPGMFFPLSVNKKDIFKAKLKHGNG